MKKIKQIRSLLELNGCISEKDILLLKRRMNNPSTSAEMVLKINELMSDFEGNMRVSPEQSKKGLDFMYNLYKTPTGKVRKNCPFNDEQKEILELAKHNSSESHFWLEGFSLMNYTSRSNNLYPAYMLLNTKGRFTYIYAGGKIVLF